MKRLVRKLNGREKGFTLVETIVALVIMGAIAVGLFSALGTSFIGTGIADERSTAKNLAESQMEYVKGLPWIDANTVVDEHGALDPDSVYPPAPITSEYSGYTVSVSTSDLDGKDENIQKIVVTVFHHDEQVLQLEGYKLR